jgi:hypothetical protein
VLKVKFSLPFNIQSRVYNLKILVEGIEAASVDVIQGEDAVIDLTQIGAEADSRPSAADYICVVYQWYRRYKAIYYYSDKVKHYTASRYATLNCNLGAGVSFWFIKVVRNWCISDA